MTIEELPSALPIRTAVAHKPSRPPVIMVHGAFCGGWCFEHLRGPFEAAGHDVEAPDLPGHAPGGKVAGVSMRDYVNAVVERVRASPEPPVLVGHSLGGLVCQLAAAQVPVRALVLLATSPPWGQPITSPVEAGAAFGLYGQGPYWLQPVPPDYSVVRAFTLDRLDEADARAVYARMVPESGRALFETLNWWLDPTAATLLPASGVRAPTLCLTGAADRIHSPTTVSLVAARLGAEFQACPGLSHWLIGEPGWEQVARRTLAWLNRRGLGSTAVGGELG